jgi:UDP-N-acetylmuramoylalanine--D-glutamate ligase
MRMTGLGFLAGQKAAVLGLGKSGLAAARALLSAGVEVVAWDDAQKARDAAAGQGIPLADLAAGAVEGAAMLVLSPGIPRAWPEPHPVVARAFEAEVPVVIDIDLLALARPEARYIGITGTNGKSTTTALLGHILQSAGVPCAVGGNLGTPAMELAPLGADGWYVLELSSYQLETVSQALWTIGVFLNISPDHLDRYPDMMTYVAAKTRLFDTPAENAVAVIGTDDDWSNAVYYYRSYQGAHRVLPIAVTLPSPGGVWVEDGRLIDGLEGDGTGVLDLREAPALPGIHNWQNAAAAYAAARAAGVDRAAAVAAIRSFPGLRHRQELVAEMGGIRFVNDSKATNADAAVRALACYRPIYWIAGGRPKPGGLAGVEPELHRVAHAFLIGEASDDFAAFLAAQAPPVPTTRCGDLDTAVAAAFEQAGGNGGDGVVLLSPACASFDQYPNFEVRGDAFVRAVRGLLPQIAGRGGAA